MKIKEGFNDKETEIKVSAQPNGSIELWIRESGKDDKETLSYMSKDELYELYKEVSQAGIDLAKYVDVIGTFWERNDAGKLHDFAKSRVR